MPQTYLFATDGSENSHHAAEFLKNITEQDDRVILVHVLSDPVQMDWELDFDPIEFEEQLQEAGNKLLSETAEKLPEDKLEVQTELLSGDPEEEITSYADDNEVDIIVMGRQGKGAVSEILLGSVSHYVMHHANCPVLIVPSKVGENF